MSERSGLQVPQLRGRRHPGHLQDTRDRRSPSRGSMRRGPGTTPSSTAGPALNGSPSHTLPHGGARFGINFSRFGGKDLGSRPSVPDGGG
jgi:hypothetical protein